MVGALSNHRRTHPRSQCMSNFSNPTSVHLSLVYRSVAEDFSRQMVNQLDRHAHVGNFLEWSPTPEELNQKLTKAQFDLAQACSTGSRERVSEICADIGNLAMRYSQLYGN